MPLRWPCERQPLTSGRNRAQCGDMADPEPTEDLPNPTKEELARTAFANVGDFSDDNGGVELSSTAPIGGEG